MKFKISWKLIAIGLLGKNVSFSPGFWAFSVQLGLSIDTKGNIAIQVTGGGGVTIGTPCTTIGNKKAIQMLRQLMN